MAVDMFLKLDQIPGESRDKTYANSIEILAFSWGASQSGSVGAPPGSGKPNLQDFSVTKYVDIASVPLFKALVLGTVVSTGTLLVRNTGTTPFVFDRYDLQNVRVTSISTGGSGGEDRLTENIGLGFEVVKWTYVKTNATGAAGTSNNYSWNVLTESGG